MSSEKSGHWNEYYDHSPQLKVIDQPSSFAQFIQDEGYVEAGKRLIDIGCGNGRDSRYFASPSVQLNVLGIDGSETATKRNLTQVDQYNGRLDFKTVNVANGHFSQMTDFDYYYMRFFIHAITRDEAKPMWSVVSKAESGSKIFLEFRTVNDPICGKGEKIGDDEFVFGHYRRFQRMSDVIEQVKAAGFTNILYESEKGNLTVVDNDNPVLGRIIAQKP